MADRHNVSQGQQELASLLRSSLIAHSSASSSKQESNETVMASPTEETSKVLQETRRSLSKTVQASSKVESGKKLRVTFRDSTDSQSTEDSTSSQNTVVDLSPSAATGGAIADTGSGATASASISSKTTAAAKETMFEKLKKELMTGTLTPSDEQGGLGVPRVTVLRRGSFTPSMTLTRSLSTTNSTSTTAGSDVPQTVKTVSFAQSVTGDAVSKEVRVAFHKRQTSLSTSEAPSLPVQQPEKPTPVEQKTVATTPTVEQQKPSTPQPQLEPVRTQQNQSPPGGQSARGTLQDLDAMPAIMKQLIAHFMTCNNDNQMADLAGKMAAILEQAWNRGGTRGVEVAEAMCRDIRVEGALSLAFSMAASNTINIRDLRLNTFRLLVSSFSSENRTWIINQVKDGGKVGGKKGSPSGKEPGELDALFAHAAEALRSASSPTGFDPELCLAGFGIVRSLLAHSNETCCAALDSGILEAVTTGLRVLPSVLTSSPSTELNQIQSTLSASIATMSTLLQSASHQQQVVSRQHAVDRLLLPICNADDNPVAQYFGLLSAVSFHRFEGSVDESSATLPSIRPLTDDRASRASMAAFLTKAGNSPSAFPFAACSLLVRRGPMSISVKPEVWLKRFLDTAVATEAGKVGFAPEVQGMALFHIAVELERVLGAGLVDDFLRSSQFLQPIHKIAESPNNLANRLAAGILTKIGNHYQKVIQFHPLSNRVPAWTVGEVRRWLTSCVGLALLDDESKSAVDFLDGDLLLTMPQAELRQALFSHSANKAKMAFFIRHLTHLKLLADYAPYDATDLDGWLSQISPSLRQYTYQILHAGIDRQYATKGHLDDALLSQDCGVTNGVHRRKILALANAFRDDDQQGDAHAGDKHSSQPRPVNSQRNENSSRNKWLYDVFICYKRASGSQLASLLKVYLEMRGFRVFLDVTDLPSGRCYDRLVETINASRHFLLILTGGCLDGVVGDEDRSDWVHREIYAALQAGCNIIPIADNFFSWPSSTSSLPADIRSVCALNTIKWLHDYQDACIDRIEKFIVDFENDTTSSNNNKGDNNDRMPSPVDQSSSNYNNNNPTKSQNSSSSITAGKQTSNPAIGQPQLISSRQQRSITASSPATFNDRGSLNNPHNPPSPHPTSNNNIHKTN